MYFGSFYILSTFRLCFHLFLLNYIFFEPYAFFALKCRVFNRFLSREMNGPFPPNGSRCEFSLLANGLQTKKNSPFFSKCMFLLQGFNFVPSRRESGCTQAHSHKQQHFRTQIIFSQHTRKPVEKRASFFAFFYFHQPYP